MTVWMVAIGLAGAADDPVPLTHEQYWTRVDRRASATGRTGEYLLAAGFAQAAMGTLLIAYGQDIGADGLADGGTALVVTGAISASVGIPLTLGGSMRAARSIQERGVHAPRVAGIMGWTSFGISVFVLPAPVTIPMSLVLGIVQMDVNHRVRERAGLPRVRPELRWWETTPVGATITIGPRAARAASDDRAPEG